MTEPCKEDEHVWSRYFVGSVARALSTEIDLVLKDDDIKSFSVCDKCNDVCFADKAGNVVVNAIQLVQVDS